MLIKLNNSRVYRGGVIADKELSQEHCGKKPVAMVNNYLRQVDIGFTLRSKGGGDTCVRLEIQWNDLKEVLLQVANEIPDSGKLFSECASIASQKSEMLVPEEERDALREEFGEKFEDNLEARIHWRAVYSKYYKNYGDMAIWAKDQLFFKRQRLLSYFRDTV